MCFVNSFGIGMTCAVCSGASYKMQMAFKTRCWYLVAWFQTSNHHPHLWYVHRFKYVWYCALSELYRWDFKMGQRARMQERDSYVSFKALGNVNGHWWKDFTKQWTADGHWPVWLRMWTLSVPLLANFCPQYGQIFSFSPVCVCQRNDKIDMWLTLRKTFVTFILTSFLHYKVKFDLLWQNIFKKLKLHHVSSNNHSYKHNFIFYFFCLVKNQEFRAFYLTTLTG